MQNLEQAMQDFKVAETPKQILFAMKRYGWDPLICMKGIPFLKLEEKTFKQIFSIIGEFGWDVSAYKAEISDLTAEDQALFIMEKFEWNLFICKIGIPHLTDKNQILFVMEKCGQEDQICKIGLQRIKNLSL